MATTASLDVLKHQYLPVVQTIADIADMDFSSVDHIEVRRYGTNYPLCKALWTKVAQPGNVQPTHALRAQDIHNNWFELERNQTLRAEMFGMTPGAGSNQTLLTNALTFAQGKEILLQAGADYGISAAVTYTGDVRLRSDGSKKAIISSASQTFSPLTFTAAASAVNTTLSASVQINTDNWDVTSATGIVPGMLMEVKSTKAWYHDPRGVAVKGELHVVARVSGSTVYTRDGAHDGYDLAAPETVTLTFFTPIRVHLEDIIVKAVQLISVGDTTHQYAGITIKYAYEPLCRNVDVDDVQSVGISHYECYRPVVEGGHSHGINHWGTGYGVNTAGCAFPTVRHRHFWQCRRGVDFSGDYIPTRQPVAHDNIISAGGINSEGTQFGWLDDDSLGASQFGFGSHGPCDGATYRNNRTGPLHTVIECRGRNENIIDHKHIGRTNGAAIELGSGENLTVINFKGYDGWTGMEDSDIFNGSGNLNSRRMENFISFNYLDGTDGFEGRATGHVLIRDCDVYVQDKCIVFLTDAATTLLHGVPNNFTMQDCKVRFSTSTGSTDCYLFYNAKTGTTVTPTGWVVKDVDYQRIGGTGRVWRENASLDFRGVLNRLNERYFKNILLADDTATSFSVPGVAKYNQVRVSIDTNDSSAFGSVLVKQGSTATAAYGTPTAVLCNASAALTGTTGTDTNLNLALNAGILYVENRLGGLKSIMLTVEYAW